MKKMSLNHIKYLLDKYLEGKTSLKEEETLIDFFQSGDIPEELEQYTAEFSHYGISRSEEPGDLVQDTIDSLNLEAKVRSNFYASPWYRVAATFLLVAVAFLSGYGLNVRNDLQNEVHSLKDELLDLKETTVQVMLKGESSHQRIQALVIASQLETVSEELIGNVLATFNEDKSPMVRSVALEFLGMHSQSESVRSVLVNLLQEQDLLSLQIELLWLIQESGDEQLIEELRELLDSTDVSEELKEEIKLVIQNDKTQSI